MELEKYNEVSNCCGINIELTLVCIQTRSLISW